MGLLGRGATYETLDFVFGYKGHMAEEFVLSPEPRTRKLGH